MADRERNLVLVHTESLQSASDFEGIAQRIAARAPDIEVFVASNGSRQSTTRKAAARRPALIFSPVALHEFRPLRGKILAGAPSISKSEQVRALAAAGFRVPESIPFVPGMTLDPAAWGPFAVLKPEDGYQGKGVRLVRTRDVRWIDPASWRRDDARQAPTLHVQRFIDTGPHATSYRVMTVLGRPVYSIASIAGEARQSLDPNGAFPIDVAIASNAGKRRLALNFAEDVIALGAAVYRVFPDVPVHGVDVIRDASTGELYVLELNLGGYTWHISSNYMAPHRAEFGLDLHAQFGALDVIADALIDATRRLAV